jgi:UDP-N-acetyl-2-amino-2-deoxyglucuronate dehydrogenase
MTMANINVGLVGAGWISGVHADSWASVQGAELVAVADLDAERAESFARKYRLPAWYSSVEDMLADPSIDAVDVCTPPIDHIDTGLKVLEAGRHLSIQKPIALTLEDCDRLGDAAARNSTVIMPSYMYRYSPLTLKAAEIIRDGGIGQPLLAFHRMAIPAWRPSPWAWNEEISGGLILEMLTHGFDMFLWWLGPAERVYAQAVSSGKTPGFNDNVSIIINHRGGAISTVQGSWIAPDNFPSHRVEVIGSEGGIHTEGGTFKTAPMYRLVHTNGEVAMAWDSMARGFTEKLQAFVDSINSGQAPDVTVADARAALEVAIAAERSIDSGLAVELPL